MRKMEWLKGNVKGLEQTMLVVNSYPKVKDLRMVAVNAAGGEQRQ